MDTYSPEVLATAEQWLDANIDKPTKETIRKWISDNDPELTEAFYKPLSFGTGGMRGIMGPGTNRMNVYTVGMATQGLANYLNDQFTKLDTIKVAIAYDSRNNSSAFARRAAEILSANNIHAYLFDDLRPTPELSFAIRELGCQGGINITASHNPKEYNGYKVYWEDGGQIIAPHDGNIVNEVKKIKSINAIQTKFREDLIHRIGKDLDKSYITKLKTLSLSPEIIKNHKDMGIVYTPIHGTGVRLVPEALAAYGFTNIHRVEAQEVPDGNFPTVHSPNPEEPAALELAIEKAKQMNAELVMATDPDGDRVGIAIKEPSGEFTLLNGNQTATLLIYYLLTKWKELGKIRGQEFIVKTIVTTDLLEEIAESFNVECYDVLTGFKYIADKIKYYEGKKKFIGGGEESYGYLAGDFVRDKDAVMSCALIAETIAWAKTNGKTPLQLLAEIYQEYHFYKERLISIKKEGRAGAEEIRKMMDNFRNNPPESINKSQVVLIHDFEKQKTLDQLSHLRYDISLPKSNVLQLILRDGSKISIRPSGTEPKIKFYFSVREDLPTVKDYKQIDATLDERIDNIIKALKIEA